MNMKIPNQSTLLTFALGAAATLVSAAFVKSKTAHKLAVRGMASGLCLKNEALRKVEIIREEAQDVYEEARRAAEAPLGADVGTSSPDEKGKS